VDLFAVTQDRVHGRQSVNLVRNTWPWIHC